MNIEEPLLLAQLRSRTRSSDSTHLINITSLHEKLASTPSRENLLKQLQKLIGKVISLLEVSIIIYVFLAFLIIKPPAVLFWNYLGDPKDHESTLSGVLFENEMQHHINIGLTLFTLAFLTVSYLKTCWISQKGIKIFSWMFLTISIMTAINIVYQAWQMPLIFPRTVLLFMRTFSLIFNFLAVKMTFKLERVYNLIKIAINSHSDIELQEFVTRIDAEEEVLNRV